MIYSYPALSVSIASLLVVNVVGYELFFSESFDDVDPFSSAGKWVKSLATKYVDQPVRVKAANNPIVGFENDKGAQLTQEMKFYGFGSKFQEVLSTDNQDLVIQYEVKLEEPLACGGAYIKLPRATDNFDMTLLNSDTPYTIMFGPDKCGSNNRVHFILQYQNPVTLEWQEKHFNETIPIKNDKRTHLYTLLLSSDNTFDILIDSHSVKKGNLLTHMNPAINPPALIDDVLDVKPSSWVDEAQIDDPTAVKPQDWDEDQPKKISDYKAVKPTGWLNDAPEMIPDPEASKPEDWDDEEDGEWEAPEVPNPACDKVGCGVWTAPNIANPLYKGKWSAPKIANPAYKGVWTPKKIPNPAFFEEKNPFAHIAPMAGVAVEVWTTSAGLLFDNFVVARSLSDALAYAKTTFKPKAEAEIAQHKREQQAEKERERAALVQKGGFKAAVEVKVMELAEFFNENPWALVTSVLAVVLPFLYLVLFGGKTPSIETDDSPNSGADNISADEKQAPEEKTADDSLKTVVN